MGLDESVKRALQEFKKADFQTFPATVTAVNLTEKTIEAIDVEGFEFFDVRLKASIDTSENFITVVPKIGSTILLTMVANDLNTLFVSMINEPEIIEGAIGTTTFKVSDEGYELNRGDENLKEVLNDYIDELNKIIVVNGTSINVTATTAIKTRLNQLLK